MTTPYTLPSTVQAGSFGSNTGGRSITCSVPSGPFLAKPSIINDAERPLQTRRIGSAVRNHQRHAFHCRAEAAIVSRRRLQAAGHLSRNRTARLQMHESVGKAVEFAVQQVRLIVQRKDDLLQPTVEYILLIGAACYQGVEFLFNTLH